MSVINKVSLIGLGSIGATYASKLHDMNPNCLSVIVDAERYDRYNAKSFVVNGKSYDFSFVKSEEAAEPADLIIVSVKFHHLQQAIQDMKNHVGPNTIILSLMNGISSERLIGEVYGMEKLLYGMVLAIDAERNDNTIKYASTAKIYFGEASNTAYSEKVTAVKEIFDKAEIGYIIPDNMLYTLWWKFMFNAGINQTSAVLKTTYKVYQEVKEAEDFLRDTMKEVMILSQRVGINLKYEDIDEFVNLVKRQSPDSKTSMLQDVEARRKTEVEMLAGTICELGEQYGVETPINRMLFQMIRTIEKTY
ncbi:MAG: 2-dehydropantoate 2-reductase [Clostridiales bacterium GWB2_37_7]|nr:MAG: 2-dehydropantoate 2-reductase [Clostridiales bacterium GWB2_37_7]